MATDAEVAAKKKKIKQLRAKVRTEEVKIAKGVSEASNEIKIARLDAEEARLNEQLKATQELSKNQEGAVQDEVESIASGPDTPNLDGAAIAADENADKENK